MKQLFVKDEKGNFLQKTYVRRAKGLVKKGRAYYEDENTICLIYGKTNKKEILMEQIDKQEILARIDAIINHMDYMKEAFMTLEKIPHDLDIEASTIRTNAIMEIVNAREQTNRDVVQLLHKMYDDQNKM